MHVIISPQEGLSKGTASRTGPAEWPSTCYVDAGEAGGSPLLFSRLWLGCLAVCALPAEEFPSDLTPTLAVERALSRHAALEAAAAGVEGVQSLVRQAGLRPNPAFSFQSENWRFGGSPGFQPGRELDLFAYLSQPIETASKRERRLSAVREEGKLAELEREGLSWRIRQEVKRAFWTAAGAARQAQLLADNRRYFTQVIDYHRVRVQEGAMAEADLMKVELEGERLQLAQRAAEADQERARLDLLRAMGEPPPVGAFRLVSDEAARPAAPPSGSALVERARTQRTEVKLARAVIERARAQLGLQQALARPDWTVVLGYKRTAGYDTVLAGVTVPLPLHNRNQGNIGHSAAEIDRAQALLRAALAQVETELSAALTALRRRQEMLEQMQTGMLDRAEQGWRVALAAYQEGGIDLLRLLDAQRARHEVQLLHARTQQEYRVSWVDLETAVGEEVP